VTLGRGDQITCDAFGADVIKIPCDAESREGRGPIVSVLVVSYGITSQTNDQEQT